MKTWGLLVFGFIIGVLGSAMFRTTPEAQKAEESRVWAQKGADQISELPREEQLKAAEEYYGKAVVLFLASLANRVSGEAPVANLGEPIVKEIAPQEAVTVSEQAELAKLTATKAEVKNAEASLPVQKSVQNLVNYAKAPYARKMSPQIRRINGSYTGILSHEGKNKGREDRIVMNVNFVVGDKNSLEGEVEILIYDPSGKLYSNKRRTGGNNSLKLIHGKKDEIYIEPAPGDFIHLNIKNSYRFSGKYFDSTGKDIGKVVLRRN
jgi:hypothetical protein